MNLIYVVNFLLKTYFHYQFQKFVFLLDFEFFDNLKKVILFSENLHNDNLKNALYQLKYVFNIFL